MRTPLKIFSSGSESCLEDLKCFKLEAFVDVINVTLGPFLMKSKLFEALLHDQISKDAIQSTGEAAHPTEHFFPYAICCKIHG